MADASAAGSKKGKKEKKSYEEKAEKFVNTTPVGEKKDMNTDMAQGYDPQAVEAAWYDWWEKQGYFQPTERKAGAGSFVIVLPPPNVTGSLHLGHSLTVSIEDSICRWRRMKGQAVMWLPGTDHAGIATQTVVERKLQVHRNLTRHDLGREQFVSEVWKWKEEYGSRIHDQLRRTGASLDWSRVYFTLDEPRAAAVQEAFLRMFNEGIIYRANRLVNWCCALRTAISDIEVETIDIEPKSKRKFPGHDKAADFGCLTSFAYKVEGSDEEIIVATTRPETMLGDTAVAVHPEDPRHKHLHGKFVVHPFVDRRIPIITDPVLVDMNFGTGAVKITPAHDHNDYECGKRHNLPLVNLFTDDGLMNENAGPYAGMKRFDARTAVVKALEERGLLRKIEGHTMRLGVCSRSGDVIEPMLKPQWFVDCSKMAARAVQAVRNGDLKIIPAQHEETWYRWLENIRDWCISRQLWWGHRIPAYIVWRKDTPKPDGSSMDCWFAANSLDEAKAKASQKLNIPVDDLNAEQDEDVLDTWFSSGLLPFSGFLWPNEQSDDFTNFFPGNLLETGHDILFFWVARMVMMSLQLTDKLPFTEVFLHSMVRDRLGRKMSKTLGNVVDPIDVMEGITLEELHAKLYHGNLDPREIEKAIKGQKEEFPKGISECGSDALRFGLLAYTAQGRDINLDIQRIIAYRQFCNKMWNATRLTLTSLADFDSASASNDIDASSLELHNRWILSRLNATIAGTNRALEEYEFGRATELVYQFFLNDLCDVHLEVIKPIMQADTSDGAAAARKIRTQHVLFIVMDNILRLMHPFMPFVTEELWQRLQAKRTLPEDRCSIMVQPYPEPVDSWSSPETEELVAAASDVVHGIRASKVAFDIPRGQIVNVSIRCATPALEGWMRESKSMIETLSRSDIIGYLTPGDAAPTGCAVTVISDKLEAFLALGGVVDVNGQLQKMSKKLQASRKMIDTLEAKISAPGYKEKVPESVQQENSDKLQTAKEEAAKLENGIRMLEALSA